MEQNPNGQTLGGAGQAVSADEMRERRLAALGGGSGNLKPPPTSSNANGNGADSTSNAGNSVITSMTAGSASSLDPAKKSQSTNGKQTWFVEPEVDDDDMELQAALALSLGKNEDQDSYEGLLEGWWKSGVPFDIASFHSFMWDTGLTTDNDKSRWVGQGIEFRGEDAETAQVPHGVEEGTTMISLLTNDHGPWGLVQSHGGPCGVLAAVQAELLRLLLFGKRNPLDYPPELAPGSVPAQAVAFLSPEIVRQSLARAIAIVLARSAIVPSAASGDDNCTEKKTVKIVLPSSSTDNLGLAWEDLEPWSTSEADSSTKTTNLTVFTISLKDPAVSSSGAPKRQKINGTHESREERIQRLARAAATFLLDDGGPNGRPPPLEHFRRSGGVILLVMSLLSTRTKEVIQAEMDDPAGTKLTSNFGHCGQELINLLLTGQAVSNVFDNTLTPSGELTCRGVQSRPDIGYLSQLESLRYCEVGGYYKSPRFPIWVVGSTSHFTVLFGDASCLKESESDLLLEKCRRAFKAVEGGEENGFISSANLEPVLKSLGVDLGGDHYYSTLVASLEVSDAGIILWDSFWQTTSRLMTGATIDQVLRDAPVGGLSKNDDDVPPLLLTQHGEPVLDHDLDKKPSAMSTKTVESDEDLAKRLASQWDLENSKVCTSVAAAAAGAPIPMEVEKTTALSDEELARKLQAEWDAEVSGTASSVAAVTGSQGSPQWSNFPDTNSSIATPDMTPMSTIEDSTVQDNKEQQHKLEFEKFGSSFSLYHYNGLRGGNLTPFRITRLSAEEAVGASIALNRGTNSHSGGSGDLEDVVRTKWPSCMINWLGKSPPYID